MHRYKNLRGIKEWNALDVEKKLFLSFPIYGETVSIDTPKRHSGKIDEANLSCSNNINVATVMGNFFTSLKNHSQINMLSTWTDLLLNSLIRMLTGQLKKNGKKQKRK